MHTAMECHRAFYIGRLPLSFFLSHVCGMQPLVIGNEHLAVVRGIIDALVIFKLHPSIRTDGKKSFAEGKADNRNSVTVSFTVFS